MTRYQVKLRAGFWILLLLNLAVRGWGCAPQILFSVSHQGWIQAMALGGRTPVPQAAGVTTTSASVTLGWNEMSAPSPITSYNVYRSTASGGEDFSSPLTRGVSPVAHSYTDNTVSPSTTYYYIVRPVIGDTEHETSDIDSEIKVMVPPVNMALVHRWIANWEMCSQLMGRTSDRNNNYRCSYMGPGNNGGYYDTGQNTFWDTFDMGCNFTSGNSNSALSCGDSMNGCLGILTSGQSFNPNGVITGGLTASGAPQIFYDRASGGCWSSNGGTSWTSANTIPSPFSGYSTLASNQPGLPPLVQIDQQPAQYACNQFSVPGIGTKRLPKRSEQFVAGAWAPSLSDSSIVNLESSATVGNCNSNNGAGLVYDNNQTPGNLDTLPGTLDSNILSVRTGSQFTKNCLSYYGLHDMLGNEWQWSSDQLLSCSTVTHVCKAGGVSTVDPSNTDWYWNSGTLPYNFDGVIAPGASNAGQNSSTDGGFLGGYTTEWNLSTAAFGATAILPALGMPLIGSPENIYNYDALVIGTGPSQFNPVKLHDNSVNLYTDEGATIRGAMSGGFYSGGAGRYAFNLAFRSDPNSVGQVTTLIGFRCMVNAGP